MHTVGTSEQMKKKNTVYRIIMRTPCHHDVVAFLHATTIVVHCGKVFVYFGLLYNLKAKRLRCLCNVFPHVEIFK